MLIRNFGHLWERRFIFWGRGGVKGHLCGIRTPNDDGSDFREQIGIYILYDKSYLPVYAGQTGAGEQRLFRRLRQHKVDHLWNRWEYFSWFGFRRANLNGKLSEFDRPQKMFSALGGVLLNEIEAALLVALEPKLNKQGPKWRDVDEYFQYVEEELEERSVSEALKKLDTLEASVAKLTKKK